MLGASGGKPLKEETGAGDAPMEVVGAPEVRGYVRFGGEVGQVVSVFYLGCGERMVRFLSGVFTTLS